MPHSKFVSWRPHPWHGLDPGPEAPARVLAYIEMTPFDLVKYEVDKETGYLRVDRPQRTSSHPPMLYGFIPRTYCGDRVGALVPKAVRGDGDPLDICVLSERPITHGDIILSARVVGGLQMIDDGEADDKILAVLVNDALWADVDDISGLPPALVSRIQHYFLTYKLTDPRDFSSVSIDRIYGREHAYEVIRAALADYTESFSAGT